MDTQGWYTVTEFAPGSYQIVEGGRYHMFLFLGRDRAVAMDGGVGVGNLRKLHESITDLPIDFILTHTHWDHLGGAHQWAKLGVHPKGKDQLAKDHAARAQGWAKQWGKPFPAGFDPASFTIRPSTFGWTLQEGGTFDLGGRRFRVFDTPGHSPDSISLLDEREGVLVTGDLVKPLDCLYLQVPTAILPDYAPSLRKLEKIAGPGSWRRSRRAGTRRPRSVSPLPAGGPWTSTRPSASRCGSGITRGNSTKHGEGSLLDKFHILDAYDRLKPRYERLACEIRFALEQHLTNRKIQFAQLLERAKHRDSLAKKLSRKDYIDPLKQIADLAGVRVVCLYNNEVENICELIDEYFDVIETSDKTAEHSYDRMGYQGIHKIVRLGQKHAGPRYDNLKDLVCEIQIRTVLQDAWALISQHLIYKNESSVPDRLRRNVNNVMSLFEIAQRMFDFLREDREKYVGSIQSRNKQPEAFLSHPIDYDTLIEYTKWKFPNLQPSDWLISLLLEDLNHNNYKRLEDIDRVVELAKEAVAAYKDENPDWFQNGTDFITKSLGFVDVEFRAKHRFARRTREAFEKYADMMKKTS
ncbi:MAG: MBL fold metallo-hydrolase [Candidatus Tectomicrobia bacterium]|nr:MBL fold metallo-hydrolase [Candidatus Tectomicrobia bacterium]